MDAVAALPALELPARRAAVRPVTTEPVWVRNKSR